MDHGTRSRWGRPRGFLRLAALLLLFPVPATAGELLVFAAASLTEAFTEIGASFESVQPGERVVFHFAGSQVLRAQIERGAPADLFASADDTSMANLEDLNLVETPRSFAGNRLIMIVSGPAAALVPDLASAAGPQRLLAIGNPHVPVGRYTRLLLAGLEADPAYGPEFIAALTRNVVTEEANVKAIVTKVSLGEVDAGIVYRTDLHADLNSRVSALPLPAEHNPVARYPIAVVRGTTRNKPARAFVAHVLAPAGQGVLRRYGFLDPN